MIGASVPQGYFKAVSLGRVRCERQRHPRDLGWPVKAPLSPALWYARLTNSS